MLEWLKITGTGPKTEKGSIELDFAESMNFITGDNGLGKTFILDVAWWAMTRTWVSRDRMALPHRAKLKIKSGKLFRTGPTPSISFRFTKSKTKKDDWSSSFDRKHQEWRNRQGRPANPGMVLYAQVDGGFSVWDPARNYRLNAQNLPEQDDLPESYRLTADQVWNGLPASDADKRLCNGLIVDWASWQRENGDAWRLLTEVIKALSPSDDEVMTPGELTRIRLDDVRDMPTLRMPYGQDVPLVHASAGMRRIVSLAYLLVWTWIEHRRACELLEQKPTRQVTFLIDEIEAHLHPKWQRHIMKALLSVMQILTADKASSVQLIVATHAPLVLASIEPHFNPETDRLFHLGFDGHFASIEQMEWASHGDASNWLTSPVFALEEARSLDAQQAIQAAQAWMAGRKSDLKAPLNTQRAIDAALRSAVPATDDVMFQWQLATNKGTKA